MKDFVAKDSTIMKDYPNIIKDINSLDKIIFNSIIREYIGQERIKSITQNDILK